MKGMNERKLTVLRQVAKGTVRMVRNQNMKGKRTRDAELLGGGKVNLQMDYLLDNTLVEVVVNWSDYAPREVRLTPRGEKILAQYSM